MSVQITVENLVKKYGNTTIISDLSLKVKQGELFTLLGPSGCGKTTLLRMIAGFNTVEGGNILFNDVRINDMEPGERNIGMVFQNYAIFPNMSVRKNVAFGLKQRKISKEEISKRTEKYLRLVQIDQYADRMPDKLSGGQQQRVALARALVIHPDVLLMDEPLSNLDAKLRIEMRSLIRDLQRDVSITTIYVTHDQEEAMAISDRIAVMKDGVIHHCGNPQNIYQRPADIFVATFIGQSNLLQGKLTMVDGKSILSFEGGYHVSCENLLPEARYARDVVVSVRPEECIVQSKDKPGIEGVICDSIFLGLHTKYVVELANGEKIDITQESSVERLLAPKTPIRIAVNIAKINLFDPESTKSIMQGVCHSVDLPDA